jgi:hypothetical protein
MLLCRRLATPAVNARGQSMAALKRLQSRSRVFLLRDEPKIERDQEEDEMNNRTRSAELWDLGEIERGSAPNNDYRDEDRNRHGMASLEPAMRS